MALHLHVGERTDALADGLADLLTTPLPDPFAREIVVVPARGVERWLTQRLSHRLGVGGGSDGVCAGVDFVSPYSLIAMLTGRERDDPWHPDNLVWPVLEVIDESLGESVFTDLARHLGHGDTTSTGEAKQARRFGVAHKLATLFMSYAVQRPALLAAWSAGADDDGAGRPLDNDLRWQPEIWRRVTSRIDAPTPIERQAATVAALRSSGDGDSLDLPPRLSLFGHTRLPLTEVELLGALGERRDVHLWLPQVSATLWARLGDAAAAGPIPRDEDSSAHLVAHPLLASLGRDSRELRRTLATAPTIESPPTTVQAPADSLLGWLQHDLRANQAPSSDERAERVLAPNDRSVQVHACHGTARQVDVLREVLLGLLEDDPSLEPRDILVMCPDIETFAPLISAGFGLADLASGHGHPAHELRVRLADRSPTATNPLLTLAAALVDVAGGRLSASQVLDLAASDSVRVRFGWSDEDLERMKDWVEQASIRWGYDADDRGLFGVRLNDNTWLLGLRRLLLGAAVSGGSHRIVAGLVPVDDVGDGSLELLGRFTEFVDRLHAFTSAAHAANTATDWATALRAAINGLTATAADDHWQLAQFEREIGRIADDPEQAQPTKLRHADVRALLAHRLRGRPTRSNFRTGSLTVCTMVPMRSVPHRVVCLVGLDDGAFPRSPIRDGDDVLARTPYTGERDARSEDRQLLLDAVASATETLVITYTGRGEHTGADRPPAVPLGELLDAVAATATSPRAESVRDQVLTQHPLQPFDETNLTPGRLLGDRPFTFDRSALAGAIAARGERVPATALITERLPERPVATDVSLADLLDFFLHPVRTFFRQRLQISTPYDTDAVGDDIPLTLDALAKWAVGDRLAADVLAGVDARLAGEELRLGGTLPPDQLGQAQLDDVTQLVRPLVLKALELRAGDPRVIDIDVGLGDRRLTGTVPNVYGPNLVTVSYSSLGAKQRFSGWLNALALAAAHPDANWTVHSIGRFRSQGRSARVAPIPAHDAAGWLRDLIDVFERGQCEPLPLPLKTSLAWAEEYTVTQDHERAEQRARDAWTTSKFEDDPIPKDDADRWHERAWGARPDLTVLLTPTLADEATGPHRLGHYAWRQWGPMLTSGHELVRGL